jgi:succinate dehydrogenase / fumarate reductase iron-sulfur subunit
MKFSIYRYNPDTDTAPAMQAMELDDNQVKPGMMLLDALLLLKAQDESLSFRRSCGEGVCGSDGMNINGRNGLACITPLASLAHQQGPGPRGGAAPDPGAACTARRPV